MKATKVNSRTEKEIKTSLINNEGISTSTESVVIESTSSEEETLPLKEELELMLKLADSSWRDFDTRRSYEWKISFGLWVALATLSGFAIKEGIKVSEWVVLFQLIVAFIYTFIWSEGLYKMNNKNQELAKEYWKKVAEKTGFKSDKVSETNKKSRLAIFNWSHGSQIAITILFLFISYLALTGKYEKIINKEKIESTSSINVINLEKN
jgi:hypothetical protein